MDSSDISLRIIEFRSSLAKYIESIELPSEVKRMVLAEIYTEVDKQMRAEVTQAITKREEKESKANE